MGQSSDALVGGFQAFRARATIVTLPWTRQRIVDGHDPLDLDGFLALRIEPTSLSGAP